MVYEITADFEQPPTIVYDALCDLERHHEWSPIHHDWLKHPPAFGDMRVGDEAHHTATVWGIPVQLRWTVTKHDRPREFELTGTARAGATMRLLATFRRRRPRGTRLVIETEIDGGPLAGIGGFVFSRVIRVTQEQAIEQLKEMLTGGG